MLVTFQKVFRLKFRDSKRERERKGKWRTKISEPKMKEETERETDRNHGPNTRKCAHMMKHN